MNDKRPIKKHWQIVEDLLWNYYYGHRIQDERFRIERAPKDDNKSDDNKIEIQWSFYYNNRPIFAKAYRYDEDIHKCIEIDPGLNFNTDIHRLEKHNIPSDVVDYITGFMEIWEEIYHET